MDIRAGALCAATVVSPPHPGAGPALPESSHSSGIGCLLSCLIWLQVKHRDDQFCSFCAAALLFFPSFWHHQVSCKRLCGHWQNKRFNRFSLCTGVATLKALGMTRLICTLPKKNSPSKLYYYWSQWVVSHRWAAAECCTQQYIATMAAG